VNDVTDICIVTQGTGLQYPNRCQGNITDVEVGHFHRVLPDARIAMLTYWQCCILRACNVPEGSGFCRDLATQTCDQGKFFAGESVRCLFILYFT
jgi:hypothetical protein